jgi:hypothetical protein
MVVAIPVNEIIKFVNEHSQLVLEIEGEATTEGTLAEQYTDTGGDHQRWRLRSAGPGNVDFYNIENVHSGMSLEVVGCSQLPGAEIVQRSYGDGPSHRQWKLVPVAGKTDVYKIQNRNSGLILDDVGGQTAAPAPVKQYGPWDQDSRQQWKILLVSPPLVSPPLASPSLVSSRVALINGNFEVPGIGDSRSCDLFPDASHNQSNHVPGWRTTATNRLIEIWKSGHQGINACNFGYSTSRQFAKLNANVPSTLYQDLALTPGTTLYWKLIHMGFRGGDTMAVDIGAPAAPIEQQRLTHDSRGWTSAGGTYTVPAGQTITRFACRSISAAGGDPSKGSFIDFVSFDDGVAT